MSVNTFDEAWIDDLRVRLTTEFEEQKARLTQLTADTGDPGEEHTRAALIATTRQTVEQLTGALQRITEGRYGLCERCAAPIPQERLEILPHARFCMPCQRQQSGH